jgi:hypothetical protein
VIKVENKQAWVAGKDGFVIQYHTSQLKPFIKPADTSTDDSMFLSDFAEMLKSYTENEPTLKEEEPQVSSPISVLATETLDFNDPRAS